MEDDKVKLDEEKENEMKVSFIKLSKKERNAIIKKFLKEHKNSPTMSQTKKVLMFGQGNEKKFR